MSLPTSPQPTQITFRPTLKQHLAWQFLTDRTTNELLFGGGGGGGKSLLGCAWLIVMCLQCPGSRWMMGRAVLKSLKESTLLTFFELTAKWGIVANVHYTYNDQKGRITFYNGSEIYLKDLFAYPSDPNFDSLGSTEYTGAFLDEANQISARARAVVLTRLRFRLDDFNLIPKVMYSCNPAKNWVYSDFYLPAKRQDIKPSRAFVQALVTDNPNAPASYVASLRDNPIRAIRERLYFGNWEFDDDPNTLFGIEELNDLFSNPVERKGEKYLICDVARLGRDKTVYSLWEGLVEFDRIEIAQTRTNEIIADLEGLRMRHGIPTSQVLVDEGGVGCLVKGTEVMTVAGWQLVESLAPGTSVYSKGDDGIVITERVERVDVREGARCYRTANGYAFSAGQRLRYRTRKEHPWRLGHWDSIVERSLVYLDNDFCWIGRDRPALLRSSEAAMPRGGSRNYRPAMKIRAAAFVRFLAWFIAEGSTAGKYIVINQSEKSRHCENIVQVLDDCGFHFYVKRSRSGEIAYVLCNKILKSWLKKNCYVAGSVPSAHSKCVPSYVKRLRKETIRLFLEEYEKGDGYKHHGLNEYVTASRVLADDLLELIFKSGQYANILVKQKKGSSSTIDGRRITRTDDVYAVYEWKSNTICMRPGDVTEFHDDTYDVHISGASKLFMVRGQDGRAFWVHNGGVVDGGRYKGFISGARPLQRPQEAKQTFKVNYANLRAQCTYTLAEYVQTHRIAMSWDNPVMRQETIEDLEQMKSRDQDKDGTLKVVSKDEMKEHLNRSPDHGDVVMMRMYFELLPARPGFLVMEV